MRGSWSRTKSRPRSSSTDLGSECPPTRCGSPASLAQSRSSQTPSSRKTRPDGHRLEIPFILGAVPIPIREKLHLNRFHAAKTKRLSASDLLILMVCSFDRNGPSLGPTPPRCVPSSWLWPAAPSTVGERTGWTPARAGSMVRSNSTRRAGLPQTSPDRTRRSWRSTLGPGDIETTGLPPRKTPETAPATPWWSGVRVEGDEFLQVTRVQISSSL